MLYRGCTTQTDVVSWLYNADRCYIVVVQPRPMLYRGCTTQTDVVSWLYNADGFCLVVLSRRGASMYIVAWVV